MAKKTPGNEPIRTDRRNRNGDNPPIPGGGKRANRRRPMRQEEAAARQVARDKRSDADQLAKLEREGHGHCREAQRLRERISTNA